MSKMVESIIKGLQEVVVYAQGRRKPDLAARAFLKVIAHDPDAVRKALAS